MGYQGQSERAYAQGPPEIAAGLTSSPLYAPPLLCQTLSEDASKISAEGPRASSDGLQLSLSLQERLSAAAERNAKRKKVCRRRSIKHILPFISHVSGNPTPPFVYPPGQVCEVQIAYRLAGHSVFPLSATRSGIRFETSYNGSYYEQYYVILDLATDEGKVRCCSLEKSWGADITKEKPPHRPVPLLCPPFHFPLHQIYRHTLPPLVPLRELAPYVAKDLARFVSAVSDYLNAYVARRQQVGPWSTSSSSSATLKTKKNVPGWPSLAHFHARPPHPRIACGALALCQPAPSRRARIDAQL